MNTSLFSIEKIKRLTGSINANKLVHVVFFATVMVIGQRSGNIGKALLTSFFVLLWSYFMHVLAHHVAPFNYFHPTHHDAKVNHETWAQITEFLVNLLQIGGLFLMYFSNVFDKWVVLFYAMFYTSYHFINYHYFDNETHRFHHTPAGLCGNFGPDYFDILFDTKINQAVDIYQHCVYNVLFFGLITLVIQSRLVNRQ